MKKRKERIDGRYFKKKKKVRGIANTGRGEERKTAMREGKYMEFEIHVSRLYEIRAPPVGRGNFLALLPGKRRQVISS